MILSKENAVDYRLIDRASALRNSLIDEIEIIESAQNLILLDTSSEEFFNEFSNFSSILKQNCSPSKLIQLKSIDFDEYLLNLLQNHNDPFIVQRCLSCILTWIINCVERNLLFFSPDFALLISSIALSPELQDQRSILLSFAILKTICLFNPQCIPALIESDFIKKIVNFYSDCPEEKIQAEILCTLYSIIKSKQVPFEIISDLTVIFANLLSEQENPNLDIMLTLTSAFAECGEECCFLLLECFPFKQLFLSFDNFSNDEQASFLRLLISVFDYSDSNSLSIISNYFRWDILLSFIDRPDNNIIIQYFANLLSSAFQKSPILIDGACETDVFPLLLNWAETEKYSIQIAALFALLQAFEYGFSTVGISLLESGLLSKIVFLLDCNSKMTILAKEVCKAILVLYNFAEENSKTVLCEALNVDCATEILEAIENNEELPTDMLEIIKECLEEIQSDQLWQ